MMRTNDPVHDAEEYASREQEIIGNCVVCGEPIHAGEVYYDIKGELVHDDFDCTQDWLSDYKVYG